LSEEALEQTAVVANCRMNRERELQGGNGYEVELDFALVDWLAQRGRTRWLDLCCGSGRALVQAEQALGERLDLWGVDLVDFFWPRPPGSRVQLVVSPLRTFDPPGTFELVTCVHGLHYVGDKLGLLMKMAGWLSPGGLLRAHLDLEHVLVEGRPQPRKLAQQLRQVGFGFDPKRRLVTASGPLPASLPWVFEGARPGAVNFTGQPAVESFYRTPPDNSGG
jgi:SAM-dependent methyltransferase